MNKQIMYILLILAGIFISVLLLSLSQPAKKEEAGIYPTQALSKDGSRGEVASVKIKQYAQAPDMQIDQKKHYQAILTTSEGVISIKLDARDTPVTTNNFVFLAKEGFYNNTIFHRVISGFMIQGGDPLGNGMGGPGYQFADEPINKDYKRGIIAMANSGPNTNGSQFFIMHQDYALPRNYVIFGEVVEGMDVVDKIATAPVTTSASGEQSTPVKPVTVRSIAIIEE